MSNDTYDDPMDTENSPSTLSDGKPDASHGTSAEPAPPVVENEVNLAEVAKLPAQILRLEEKRDREAYDDAYDVTVEEAAVDVETLACNYEGNAFFVRARFIARHCPTLRADAYCALINHIKENTKDITHYITFFNELEVELGKKDAKDNQKLLLNLPIPIRDKKWIEETGGWWQITLDALQGEYKRHKDEGVKESTRRSMEDLFFHYLLAGKVEDAIRLYSRGIRDYCTQLKHSIIMWTNWIDVSISANDWQRLESVTSTAYRSLKDADDAEKNNGNPQPSHNSAYMLESDSHISTSQLSNRQLIETALSKSLAASILVRLRNRRYLEVVEILLQTRTDSLQPKWFVTSSDLGIYSMLCAMATIHRSKLRELIGANGAFRKLLESEPLFIEMMTSYTSSRFGRCFEIMRTVKNRLLLDPFISRNVDELFGMIRQKCVIQYLEPYSTVKMSTMCDSLGTSRVELQTTLIELMENNDIRIKIDQNAGVIRMIDDKNEENTLKRVNETCNRSIKKAKLLLWKTTLASANIHSISDKETRPKRKNQKDSSKTERSLQDIDDDVAQIGRALAGGVAHSGSITDDFNIAYEQQQQQLQQEEDLGDI